MAIQVSEKDGVRFLHFGSELVQGAMRIARPTALELPYTRDMMLPLLLRAKAWPRDVLQVGLGTASMTKFVHRYRPRSRIAIVEILPEVLAVARAHFKLPVDDRVRVTIGEGHEFVASARKDFDLILIDGFDAEARTGMLDTVPFYVNCRARLAPAGMFAVNLIDRGGGRSITASARRLREAFDGHVLVLPKCAGGNTVALAADEPFAAPDAGALQEAASKLKADTGLDLSEPVSRMLLAATAAMRQ